MALLLGCSPATRHGYDSPTGPTYSLSIVSGDHQIAPAVIQPITVSVGPGSSTTQNVTPPAIATVVLLPLVVEVRDSHGQLVDGVLVVFSDPDPATSVLGLGTETTGQAVFFSDGTSFPATHGQAATHVKPYRIGTWSVNASVDPSSGTSNSVSFSVTGT